MREKIDLWGDTDSGNCAKVLIAAVRAGVPFRWHAVDTSYGTPRLPEVEAINPAGQVPIMVLPGERAVAQSGAINLYLLEGTALLPDDRFELALVHQWLFWEQYSHEPYIAVCRSQMVYSGVAKEDREPWRVERGEKALDLMERRLQKHDWIAIDRPSAADVALFAYTRLAEEGGFDLEPRPSVRSWIERCEGEFADELAVLEWIGAGNETYSG